MNKKVKEDLNLAPIEVQDYTRGSDKYMAEIEQWFKDHSDVITRYEFINPVYPLRGDPIWYNCPIIKFIYKSAIEVEISCYHDGALYTGPNENDYIDCNCEDGGISQLEELGIFDDDTLYDYVREIDDAWDDFHGEFYFTVTSIGVLEGDTSVESYELGYDSFYSLDECFPLDWTIEADGLIDSYIDDMDTEAEKRWLVERGLRTAEDLGIEEPVTEDITVAEPTIPDWGAGHEEAIAKLKALLNSYDAITRYEINEKAIYPLRDRLEWWSGDWILTIVYKDMLKFDFFASGEVDIPVDDGDEDYMYGTQDFEEHGIYTDAELYDHMRWLENECNNYCDNNMPYGNFYMELTGDYENEFNSNQFGAYSDGSVYGYDMGYEDVWSVSEMIDERWLTDFIENDIPDIISKYNFKSNAELEAGEVTDEPAESEEEGNPIHAWEIHEDVSADTVGVLPFNDETIKQYGLRVYSKELNAANRDNAVWGVGCWEEHYATWAYHVEGLTFDEAWEEFSHQLVSGNWLTVELRYRCATIIAYDPHPIREDNKLTKQQVLNDLIETFKYVKVNNLTDAVYVLPNGNILDTKGPYENSQHENIAKYIEEKYNIKDKAGESGSKFMNSIGAVRVTPWIPGIIVPSTKLTEKQEDTLFSIIKLLSTKVKADHPLMVLSEDGKQFIEYSKVKNPEEVITAILGYQILGILKEHLAPGKEMRFLNKLNK